MRRLAGLKAELAAQADAAERAACELQRSRYTCEKMQLLLESHGLPCDGVALASGVDATTLMLPAGGGGGYRAQQQQHSHGDEYGGPDMRMFGGADDDLGGGEDDDEGDYVAGGDLFGEQQHQQQQQTAAAAAAGVSQRSGALESALGVAHTGSDALNASSAAGGGGSGRASFYGGGGASRHPGTPGASVFGGPAPRALVGRPSIVLPSAGLSGGPRVAPRPAATVAAPPPSAAGGGGTAAAAAGSGAGGGGLRLAPQFVSNGRPSMLPVAPLKAGVGGLPSAGSRVGLRPLAAASLGGQ